DRIYLSDSQVAIRKNFPKKLTQTFPNFLRDPHERDALTIPSCCREHASKSSRATPARPPFRWVFRSALTADRKTGQRLLWLHRISASIAHPTATSIKGSAKPAGSITAIMHTLSIF